MPWCGLTQCHPLTRIARQPRWCPGSRVPTAFSATKPQSCTMSHKTPGWTCSCRRHDTSITSISPCVTGNPSDAFFLNNRCISKATERHLWGTFFLEIPLQQLTTKQSTAKTRRLKRPNTRLLCCVDLFSFVKWWLDITHGFQSLCLSLSLLVWFRPMKNETTISPFLGGCLVKRTNRQHVFGRLNDLHY